MTADRAQEDFDGQGHTPFMMRHVRVGSRASTVQLVPAAMRLYKAAAQSNSSTVRKYLGADMQLSSRCDHCWSSHILSAMNGLRQSYMFK